MAILLVLIYAAAWFSELHFPLSPEAQHYQEANPDEIRNGLSWIYLFAKLFWILGTVSGAAGLIFVCRRKNSNTELLPKVLLAISAPLIACAAYSAAPPFNYPSVEPMYVTLLWCTSSALWASVLAIAWMRSRFDT